MKQEKKVWLIEQYAQKIWTVSLVLTQEAARAGQYGKGYATVAHEARILADKLLEYVAKIKFESPDDITFRGITDFAVMLKFLAVNADIEIRRMVEISMDFNIPKSMAVFAEELRRIAIELNELSGKQVWQTPFVIPELVSYAESSANYHAFLSYSIAGYPLIENLKNIVEIVYHRKADITEATLSPRGREIPNINFYQHLNLSYTGYDEDMQTVMIISPNGVNLENLEELYAVPIDDLDVNAIFHSRAGRAVPPKKGHAFADYTRECWDVIGGDQVSFIDWKKFINIE